MVNTTIRCNILSWFKIDKKQNLLVTILIIEHIVTYNVCACTNFQQIIGLNKAYIMLNIRS